MFDIQTWGESSHVICCIGTGDTVAQVLSQPTGGILGLKDSMWPSSEQWREKETKLNNTGITRLAFSPGKQSEAWDWMSGYKSILYTLRIQFLAIRRKYGTHIRGIILCFISSAFISFIGGKRKIMLKYLKLWKKQIWSLYVPVTSCSDYCSVWNWLWKQSRSFSLDSVLGPLVWSYYTHQLSLVVIRFRGPTQHASSLLGSWTGSLNDHPFLYASTSIHFCYI